MREEDYYKHYRREYATLHRERFRPTTQHNPQPQQVPAPQLHSNPNKRKVHTIGELLTKKSLIPRSFRLAYWDFKAYRRRHRWAVRAISVVLVIVLLAGIFFIGY